ncbi:MAG TPA: peptidoglycan DD-metalloendopeptidase family protein [Steroidobacteraceae bacterium]|nr:peptidoglycan DD-metalloendopeptidase family protein [Steroidobacteraceae bacterium]
MHDPRRWLLLAALLAAAPAHPAGTVARQAAAEAQLKAIQGRIAAVRNQVDRDQVQSDHLNRDLEAAELSVAAARARLAGLTQQRAERSARRAALAAERNARQADLTAGRAALAAQLRAAYLIGPQEPLKLLLNQEDPVRAGRMFAYYGYFGRARADVLRRIQDDVARLAQLDAGLASEQEQLGQLAASARQELSTLDAAQAQRTAALRELEAEAGTHAQMLRRLQAQQASLTNLLEQLRHALDRFPVGGAFAGLRGRLAWPVAGRVVARYGETRAGGLKWDGVLIDTRRGADVRAVYQGRVIYADWLPGLGLLTIIDHGGGYLSLYGHNERLYKAAGDTVAAGEVIATAGDTGGASQPQLYFEIRRGSRPVDPGPWFKVSSPGG